MQVDYGHDSKRGCPGLIKHTVRKTEDTALAHILKHAAKEERVLLDALERGLQCVRKPASKARLLALIRVGRLPKLGPRLQNGDDHHIRRRHRRNASTINAPNPTTSNPLTAHTSASAARGAR